MRSSGKVFGAPPVEVRGGKSGIDLSSCITSMDEGDAGVVDNSLALVLRGLEDDDANEGSRNELLQMQRIRELDMEPLEEEEDDSEAENSNDSRFFNHSITTTLSFLSGSAYKHWSLF